ncbi:hypothetical protein EBR21_02485, partial [bacterium]|nr:hypothetical protein [bacterium]
MMLRTILATLNVQLKNTWHWLRTQAPGLSAIAAFASLICFYAGFALQRQGNPNARLAVLSSTENSVMPINDWVAEYFSCSNNQCKRVLKRMPDGKYEIATEKLPLGRGRFVDDKAFSTRPTNVRLTHRLTEAEQQLYAKNWSKEKPVVALAGQPVCEQSNCKNEDLTFPASKLAAGEQQLIQFDSH